MVLAIRCLPVRSMHFLCHHFWQRLPTPSYKHASFSGKGGRGAAVLVEISKFPAPPDPVTNGIGLLINAPAEGPR
jgi:hypothetical protein